MGEETADDVVGRRERFVKYATPPKKMKVQGQMISEPFAGPLAAPSRVQNEAVIAAKTSHGLLIVATRNVQS